MPVVPILTLLVVSLARLASLSAEEQAIPAGTAAVVAQARSLIDRNEPAAAIRKLHLLPDLSSPQIRYLLAVAYYRIDNHGQAIEQLEPVLAMFPKGSIEHREVVQIFGLSQYLTGHIAESIPYLEQVAAWRPDSAEYAHILGRAYLQTRRYRKARESFARMFRVASESAAAHLLTAQMMMPIGFDEHAERELKQALQKDPRLPQANFFLGQMALFSARLAEAVTFLKREIEINPGYAMAFYRLGDAYILQGKLDEAIEPLQKSIRLNDQYSGPYVLLGKTYLKRRQLANAEGFLQQAIQLDPNNKSAHYLLARVLQRMGRHEEAKKELEVTERLHGDAEP